MHAEDIDFILSHFDWNSLFPRKMMTKKYHFQFTVNSKDEIIQRCIESDFTDCRISAYPEYTKWKKHDMIRYPPNFIFIDLDLSNFQKYRDPQKMLDKTLQATLNRISTSFSTEQSHHTHHTSIKNRINVKREPYNVTSEVRPTVLWSGNGYHIYLPIQAVVLDDYVYFSKNKFPNLFINHIGKYADYCVSEVFLIFAKDYFSNGKADPQHHPKFKTSMIRIPNTYNSKCLNKGLKYYESRVTVIQKWNGYRPPIQYLTKQFKRWLFQVEINQSTKNKITRFTHSSSFDDSINSQIQWIEKLLQTGIADGRKETLRLILAPYLSKRKSYDESVNILEKWLDKCNKVKELEKGFLPKQRINQSLRNTKGFLKLNNLRAKYPWLYHVIQMK